MYSVHSVHTVHQVYIPTNNVLKCTVGVLAPTFKNQIFEK